MSGEDISLLLRRIRTRVMQLEKDARPVVELRESCLKPSGRLTEAGRELLDWAHNHSIPQSAVARLLGITPGAVSNYHNR